MWVFLICLRAKSRLLSTLNPLFLHRLYHRSDTNLMILPVSCMDEPQLCLLPSRNLFCLLCLRPRCQRRCLCCRRAAPAVLCVLKWWMKRSRPLGMRHLRLAEGTRRGATGLSGGFGPYLPLPSALTQVSNPSHLSSRGRPQVLSFAFWCLWGIIFIRRGYDS